MEDGRTCRTELDKTGNCWLPKLASICQRSVNRFNWSNGQLVQWCNGQLVNSVGLTSGQQVNPSITIAGEWEKKKELTRKNIHANAGRKEGRQWGSGEIRVFMQQDSLTCCICICNRARHGASFFSSCSISCTAIELSVSFLVLICCATPLAKQKTHRTINWKRLSGHAYYRCRTKQSQSQSHLATGNRVRRRMCQTNFKLSKGATSIVADVRVCVCVCGVGVGPWIGWLGW